MFIVGFVMLVSAVLMVLLSRSNRITPVTVDDEDDTVSGADTVGAAGTAKGDVR